MLRGREELLELVGQPFQLKLSTVLSETLSQQIRLRATDTLLEVNLWPLFACTSKHIYTHTHSQKTTRKKAYFSYRENVYQHTICDGHTANDQSAERNGANYFIAILLYYITYKKRARDTEYLLYKLVLLWWWGPIIIVFSKFLQILIFEDGSLFVCLFLFWDGVGLIYPGWPELPNVEHAGLKFVMPIPSCKIIIIHCCYCCYCSETRSHITQAGCEFPLPWPLPPECWGFSCIPLCSAYDRFSNNIFQHCHGYSPIL